MSRVVLEKVGEKVLKENDRIAQSLRERFGESGVACVNLISSPGSGKTLLLERTLERLGGRVNAAVLTGDIQTDNDARRLGRYGFPVRQITTAGACHLDARMVERALADWDVGRLDLLLIENVGNLVCPTSYDLGEEAKVVLLSVTEGDDKPSKYPGIFHKATAAVLTKIDLLPYVEFSIEAARANARAVNSGLEFLEVSSTTGAGIDTWIEWLTRRTRAKRSASA